MANQLKSKESILDLNKHLGKSLMVKFTGGREVTGILRGYDTLVNLVLEDCVETLRDPDDPYRMTDETRKLGLVVCRGSSVMLLNPEDGHKEIPNPFANEDQKI